jgi:DNA-binding CsgD family transcriptional regulator
VAINRRKIEANGGTFVERRQLRGGTSIIEDRDGAQPQRRAARVAVMTSCEFWTDLLATTLRYRGIVVVAQPHGTESLAVTLADRLTASDVLLRLLTLQDYPVDLEEFHAARRIKPDIGLVLLVAPSDLRIVGIDLALLPQGTRLARFNHPGGTETVASAVLAAFRQPLVPLADPTAERQFHRVPLTDEQVQILRAISSGLSNEQIAKLRFTTVGAVRNIITRTAAAIGVGQGLTPSVTRAQLASVYLQLLDGVDFTRLRRTLSST